MNEKADVTLEQIQACVELHKVVRRLLDEQEQTGRSSGFWVSGKQLVQLRDAAAKVEELWDW